MKFEKTYIDRLSKLAHHLSSGCLFEKYLPMIPPHGVDIELPPVFETKDGIKFCHFAFVTNELPFLFPVFFAFDRRQKPVLLKRPDLEPHQAFGLFMGLSEQEFMHFATPHSQKLHLGGRVDLPYDSTPQEVGRQIFGLIEAHIRMN